MAFNISYVYQAVDKFSGTANKIARSINKIAEKSKKANADIKKLGRGIRDTGVKLTAFATTSIGFLGFSLLKAASDAEESASKFDTVFRNIGKSANTTAKELSRSFGLSRTEAKQLLGDTGDLLTGFGFTQESALDLSTQVQKLAVDLASFTNFSGGAAGASAALTKALLGERESVKSLGISILEEDVKARVKQLVTVEKMTFASMRQAKAFATLQLAQEQSKNAIGDFARTQDGFANKTRIMSAAIKDLKERLGEQLLPIASKIVGKITELTRKFEDSSPRVKKLILVIGGLVAVAGPLLLILGGMVLGLGFLLSPIGLVVAGIGAIAAAVLAFKPIGDVFRIIFHSIRLAIGFAIAELKSLGQAIADITPDFGVFETIGKFFSSASKSVGSFGQNITNAANSLAGQDNTFGQDVRNSINADISSQSELNGKIVVEAAAGTKVQSAASSVKGAGGNLGMSMAGAG